MPKMALKAGKFRAVSDGTSYTISIDGTVETGTLPDNLKINQSLTEFIRFVISKIKSGGS